MAESVAASSATEAESAVMEEEAVSSAAVFVAVAA